MTREDWTQLASNTWALLEQFSASMDSSSDPSQDDLQRIEQLHQQLEKHIGRLENSAPPADLTELHESLLDFLDAMSANWTALARQVDYGLRFLDTNSEADARKMMEAERELQSDANRVGERTQEFFQQIAIAEHNQPGLIVSLNLPQELADAVRNSRPNSGGGSQKIVTKTPPSVVDIEELLSMLEEIARTKDRLPFRLRGALNVLGLYVQLRDVPSTDDHLEWQVEAGGKFRSYLKARNKVILDSEDDPDVEPNSWNVMKFDEATWQRRFAHLVWPTYEIAHVLAGLAEPSRPFGETELQDAKHMIETEGTWIPLITKPCGGCGRELAIWDQDPQSACPECGCAAETKNGS